MMKVNAISLDGFIDKVLLFECVKLLFFFFNPLLSLSLIDISCMSTISTHTSTFKLAFRMP